MQSSDVLLSDQLDNILSDLEKRFKRPPLHLHYVTAREMYNIAKAPEAGKTGNPNAYRDFAIQQPANRKIFCNHHYALMEYSKNRVSLEVHCDLSNTVLKYKESPLEHIEGEDISRVDVVHSQGSLIRLQVEGKGECTVSCNKSEHRKQRKTVGNFKMPFDLSWNEMV